MFFPYFGNCKYTNNILIYTSLLVFSNASVVIPNEVRDLLKRVSPFPNVNSPQYGSASFLFADYYGLTPS